MHFAEHIVGLSISVKCLAIVVNSDELICIECERGPIVI